MSKYRFSGRGPGGRPLCRWCGTETEPPRRTWCSEKCVDEYKLQNDPGARRNQVFKRDKGVCVKCGLDCEKFRNAFMSLYREARGPIQPAVTALRNKLAYGGRYDFWEADHIVPQVEGGGHELDNLRTLCLWCHREETAALAKRRAQQRQEEKEANTNQTKMEF